MKSNKNNNIIYVRLEKEEEIMSSLYEIVKKYKVVSGWINGIGAIKSIVMGSYDTKKKTYNKNNFNEDYELVSFIGNISTKDEEPFIHAHITISDHDCNALGGHLFSAKITATGEFMISITDVKINRELDNNIELYLWEFKNCGL